MSFGQVEVSAVLRGIADIAGLLATSLMWLIPGAFSPGTTPIINLSASSLVRVGSFRFKRIGWFRKNLRRRVLIHWGSF